MAVIEVLGTGNASQVPQWGCDCRACLRAKQDPAFKRRPCSISITTAQGTTMIDAGRTDLAEHYDYSQITRFIITHFHMDHVQGLFHLRWANTDQPIPIFRPNDLQGSDDLYKHPGCFDFQDPWIAFKTYNLGDMRVTPVPLNHSKPTFGYFIELANIHIAYLTDTVGLPSETTDFLRNKTINYCFLDCSEPPRDIPPRNHNDLNIALSIVDSIKPLETILTHISHQFDCWLMLNKNALPKNVKIGVDHLKLTL
jgi:phosphoribosyl 1,2-cyclic phosphate phosphodiesterase